MTKMVVLMAALPSCIPNRHPPSSAFRPPPPRPPPPPSNHDASELVEVLRGANEDFAKVAFATAVAGLVIFCSPGDALAAKSGGRVGGQAFRSAPPPPRAAPRIDNSRRTNIFVNPPSLVAPPLYGGWGWSPFSYFVPGPSIAIGVSSGFNILGFLLLIAFVSGIINSFRRRDDDFDD